MKYKILILINLMFISEVSNCQANGTYAHFPDSNDSKGYFKLLFGNNGSINLPYQIIKIEIQDHPYFIITSKGEFKNYFKNKYKISDSLAVANQLQFLVCNNKIPYSDTVYFTKNMQIGRIEIHHDSILNKYRTLDLIDFLNEYCSIPQFELNIFTLAYMFEKRMLYDWNNHRIDFYTKSILANKYFIKWNEDKKVWKSSNKNQEIKTQN